MDYFIAFIIEAGLPLVVDWLFHPAVVIYFIIGLMFALMSVVCSILAKVRQRRTIIKDMLCCLFLWPIQVVSALVVIHSVSKTRRPYDN